jgi:hypothetical protein
LSSRRCSNACGASSFARAAASSIARGSPSSDRRRVVGGQGEGRLGRVRTRDEQRDRGHGDQLVDGWQAAGIRSREWRHPVLVLRPQTEGRPTRGQHPHVGARGEEISNDLGRRQEVLEVVEDEQHGPGNKERDHQVAQRPRAVFPHPEDRSDRRQDQVWVAQGREVDKPRTTREALAHLSS